MRSHFTTHFIQLTVVIIITRDALLSINMSTIIFALDMIVKFFVVFSTALLIFLFLLYKVFHRHI